MTSLRSISSFNTVTQLGYMNPRGVLPYQEVGGLGPGIEFRGKIWGKVQSSSPNKRKNLWSSVTTRRKNWEKITILGTFGVISEIQRAKFGVSVTYIFGGKNLGPSPPKLLRWKYPLWDMNYSGCVDRDQSRLEHFEF